MKQKKTVPEIIIQRADKRWMGHSTIVRRAAKAALAEECKKMAVSLTILLTHDHEVQQLNAQYRGKNKPTNVLSFPDGAKNEAGRVYLGDMALAFETIEHEAVTQGKRFEHHLTHLVIHGVLHLLGHDHLLKREAKIMELLEISILSTMGIANPYECD